MPHAIVMPGYEQQVQFTRDWTPFKLIQEGYKADAAVHASIGLWTLAFSEPKPKLYDPITGDPLDEKQDHPLRYLLKSPNPYMDWDEFRRITINFRLCTGNCYAYIVRDQRTHEPIALYPYHDGWIQPVAAEDKWISHFRYTNGVRKGEDIAPENIIHLKWFQPDPEAPWKGMAPLLALGRDIDTNVSMAKLMYAAVQNGAKPGVVIKVPQPKEGQEPVSNAVLQRIKTSFMEKFSGQGYGKAMTVLDGMDVQELGMNFKEMDMTALHDIPEAHICAVLFTPIGVVGLTAGLKNSTYSNREGDMRIWTEQRLVPVWSADDSAYTRGLGNAFEQPVEIKHDTKGVYALRENDAKLEVSTSKLYTAGILSQQEARSRLGLGDPEEGALFYNKVALQDNQDNTEPLPQDTPTGDAPTGAERSGKKKLTP